MKIISVLRTALLVAAVVGLSAADAKKPKLCDADHPAPAPAPGPSAGGNPGPAPGATPGAPAPAPGPGPAPAAPAYGPGPAPAAPAVGTTPAPAKAESATISISMPNKNATAGNDEEDDEDNDDDDSNDDKAQGDNKPASSAPASSAPAPAPAGGVVTSAGNIKASFTYKGKDAGGPGTYQMVTDVETCSKTPHAMYSPISPLDDDLTFVFRGPMTIHNVAIFDGSSGSWNKVSSFDKAAGKSENIVFLNNRNIDYGGKSAPQGYAAADGRGKAESAQLFSGVLGGATNANGAYGDEKTGAEVNIFQDKKCGADAECKGYYDKDGTALLGWTGAKKIFVTKVQMPRGPAPDLPAVWALNGQIVRSNQYQCNCRGMGKEGGCGELDIVEVLEKDTSVLATHYYKYADSTGHDSWAKRPIDEPAVYITVIDESFGVKVIEVGCDEFDFGAGSISKDVVAKWLSA